MESEQMLRKLMNKKLVSFHIINQGKQSTDVERIPLNSTIF